MIDCRLVFLFATFRDITLDQKRHQKAMSFDAHKYKSNKSMTHLLLPNVALKMEYEFLSAALLIRKARILNQPMLFSFSKIVML